MAPPAPSPPAKATDAAELTAARPARAGSETQAGTGSHAGHDLLPFTQDPWWQKALLLFFVVMPLAATGYAIWQLWGSHVGLLEVGLLVGAWVVTGMGISVGFHRMLTHRAFKANAFVRAVTLTTGSMAFQGTPADWAATHIKHHAHADQEDDPHSPLHGFFHAHMGWLFRDRFVREGVVHRRLREDPIVDFLGRHYAWVAGAGLVIPAAIGGLVTGTWTGAFSGLIWGGLARVFLGHHITWSVNSISHTFGTRPFDTVDRARNNVVVALLGFGEGWHNNHHAFPKAAFLGLKWWQFDPGRWAIKALERIGWAWDVWMPDPSELDRRRASPP